MFDKENKNMVPQYITYMIFLLKEHILICKFNTFRMLNKMHKICNSTNYNI